MVFNEVSGFVALVGFRFNIDKENLWAAEAIHVGSMWNHDVSEWWPKILT